MFLLRYRDPVRYGAWNDGMEARRHPDGAGIFLAHALNAVLDGAHGALSERDELTPLAEGPEPPPLDLGDDDPHADGEEGGEVLSPDMAAFAETVRLAAAPGPSDAALDSRSTLVVRRPRRARGRGVA